MLLEGSECGAAATSPLPLQCPARPVQGPVSEGKDFQVLVGYPNLCILVNPQW